MVIGYLRVSTSKQPPANQRQGSVLRLWVCDRDRREPDFHVDTGGAGTEQTGRRSVGRRKDTYTKFNVMVENR